MDKAFVFGKFLPFHKGHEAMICFALTRCDFLTVLVCCSDRENISGIVRKAWIEKTFPGQKNMEVRIFNYLEAALPNTSSSSRDVSATWAAIFKKELPGYSLVITSEPYGDFVAEYMHIGHIPFDMSKSQVPVSATLVRNDLLANWNFLPDAVKADLAIKVVILGTESTGKTTLTEKLANHFHCSKVLEAGRDLIADSHVFTMNDLYAVANEHARRINKAVLGDSALIIIDTDIHITQSYSRFSFELELSVSDDIYNSNKADLYLYLNNDVDHIQDGTRLNKKERDQLDCSHRQILKERGIDIIEIKGGWEERFEQAILHITRLTAQRTGIYRV